MGRKVYWTEDRILENIGGKKYASLKAWRDDSPQSYRVAKRSDYFFEQCTNIIKNNYPRGRKLYWTPELCFDEAQKFTSKRQWSLESSQSYRVAKGDEELFERCTAHMNTKYNNWTLEECIAKAKEFGTARKWNEGCSGSYAAACNNDGWMDECKKHLKVKAIRRTLEDCQNIASQYSSRSEWQKGDKPSYMTAYRKGWLDKCSHKK